MSWDLVNQLVRCPVSQSISQQSGKPASHPASKIASHLVNQLVSQSTSQQSGKPAGHPASKIANHLVNELRQAGKMGKMWKTHETWENGKKSLDFGRFRSKMAEFRPEKCVDFSIELREPLEMP